MSQLIDLTLMLDCHYEPYSYGAYQDPALEVSPWSSLTEQSFRVDHISCGTQTGTHIDAPAHFDSSGATLEALPISALVGPYCLLDFSEFVDDVELDLLLSRASRTGILFLRCLEQQAQISASVLHRLLALNCQVWVMAGSISVADYDDQPFWFNQQLAANRIWLVEDLDWHAAMAITHHGELMALPMRLSGVSGAPCRVLVRCW